ncbi:CCA tRNA nucleotidyltransferase, mitochondrial [Scheffersomyces spartinae]|uniref:CCA tRNA nucleotidyltransferase, mitochondrial n=1 Tax=Scheffersomyces spartinae TaxID=45513 RepID=A0A9P8AHE2_9ASCO|nr:CCA tRNA nucleotidyltransferase, mitochondrial [Scheffersomyces spartinae]KAG7192417.1 CCA tRNA nucleotidyltransferase, mitochondrial [Scheffersomyces spartinae]
MRRTIHNMILLNSKEQKIRDLLIDFCNEYNQQTNNKDPLELRISGGWVRDKLLGLESHDLDIAINTLLGEEFVTELEKYVGKYRPELKMETFHTIKKNPEKSKHLETCTTKLFDMDIDFVNLRSEEYSNESRVPIVRFGTAEEDALRRDATLNALFYNMNKDEIEDYTKTGIEDLQNGILRTPLAPLQTFLDDPLRVLRMIRFASRFSFIVDPTVLEAMANKEIKDTLLFKISRERVGVEVEKMLISRHPEYGLKLINYGGLSECIFSPGGEMLTLIENVNDKSVLDNIDLITQHIPKYLNLVANLYHPVFETGLNDYPRLKRIFQATLDDPLSIKIFWYSSILQPYDGLQVKTNPKKINSYTPLSLLIVRDGLKLGKHHFEPVGKITQGFESQRPILERYFRDPQVIKRSDLGNYMRYFGSYSSINILVNCFSDVVEAVQNVVGEDNEEVKISIPDPHTMTDLPVDDDKLFKPIQKVLYDYDHFIKALEGLKLMEAHNIKHLVDGKTLMKVLGRKPGPWMAKTLDVVMTWQLDNPEGTEEACVEYIKHLIPEK